MTKMTFRERRRRAIARQKRQYKVNAVVYTILILAFIGLWVVTDYMGIRVTDYYAGVTIN